MDNVDKSEIEKFNLIASEWWNPKGKFKPLHSLNSARINFIKSYANLNGSSLSDIGCGGGLLAEPLCKNGAITTAIDMAEDSLEVAKKHAKEAGLDINYIKTTVEDFALNNPGKYDYITCMEMLEHVPDPSSIIKSCSDLLKPGGLAFFSTLNRSVQSFLASIIGAEYIMNLLPKGTHSYEKYIKPSEMVKMCNAYNLNLISAKGISYNPIFNTSKITNNLSVNYIAVFKKGIK